MKSVLIIAYLLLGGAMNIVLLQANCGKKQTDSAVVNNQRPEMVKSPASSQTDVQSNKNVPISSGSKKKIKWARGTYAGLTVGESTYNDVKKILGRPRWEGYEEVEDSDDESPQPRSEFNFLLQYSSGGVEVITGEKSKIVKDVTFSPNREITRAEVVSRYGQDYFEIDSGESFCVTDDMRRGPSEKNLAYPIVLVYPEKGMYILIKDNNTVMHIGFSAKCLD